MTDRLTDTELDVIRERLAAATPGPWEAREEDWGLTLAPRFTKDGRLAFAYGYGWDDDANFIARAPCDIANLLAEVDRLRAVLEEETNHETHSRTTHQSGREGPRRELAERFAHQQETRAAVVGEIASLLEDGDGE